MKVCIYGAGAIGGWIGVGWRGGPAVSVVARGATLDALQRDGLLADARRRAHARARPAVADPAELGVQDLVVIAVKAPALAGVAEAHRPADRPRHHGAHRHERRALVVLRRRLRRRDHRARGCGRRPRRRHRQGHSRRATSSAAWCTPAARSTRRASCKHHFGNKLIVGEPSGGATPRVQKLVELLKSAGIDTTLSPQIQKDAWFKLWGNMTVNPISALTGATTDLILGDDLVRGFISAA
jgi:2-dehydropantoate 2-reductase